MSEMSGMDESIRNDFYRVILKEFIAAPRMLMISTHYLNEIRQLVEDVLIVHEGQIRMHATIDELDYHGRFVNVALWKQHQISKAFSRR